MTNIPAAIDRIDAYWSEATSSGFILITGTGVLYVRSVRYLKNVKFHYKFILLLKQHNTAYAR